MCQHLSDAESTSCSNQTQTVPCRICGHTMEFKPWIFNGHDSSIVTCENRDCPGWGYTFTAHSYHTVNLIPYMK